jgi:hypothetical protein
MNRKQGFAIVVGQPLLAVRFCPAETGRDSQEWLSYDAESSLARDCRNRS